MKQTTINTTSAKLKFAGLYALAIVLMLFILFPFLEGNTTTVATKPRQQKPENQGVEVVKADSTEIKKLYEQHEKSLVQYQSDLKDRDNQISALQAKIQQLQQTASNTTPQKPQPTSSAELENLKSRLAAMEKKNTALVQLNNDLKKNNEYLTAQLNSKGK